MLLRKTTQRVKISNNFSEDEFGINNRTPESVKNNIYLLVKNVLQPLRDAAKIPIGISSGYRTKEHNEEVGGVKTSQHITGQAADIYPVPNTDKNRALLFDIIKYKLDFDQVIYYPPGFTGYKNGGIHVSYNNEGNRKKSILKTLADKKEKDYSVLDYMKQALGIN
jgi:hypothetical protein